jgi:hypothetical protein
MISRPHRAAETERGRVVAVRDRVVGQAGVTATRRRRQPACAAAVAGGATQPTSGEVGTPLLGQAGRFHRLPRLALRPSQCRHSGLHSARRANFRPVGILQLNLQIFFWSLLFCLKRYTYTHVYTYAGSRQYQTRVVF